MLNTPVKSSYPIPEKKISVPRQQAAPLSFIENKGQIHDQYNKSRSDIQFKLAAAGGLSIFIGDGAIHYQFSRSENVDQKSPQKILTTKPDAGKVKATMCRMDVELVGANKNAKYVVEEKQDYYERYFTAATGEKGATAHAYNKIVYKDIYANIDWVLYTKGGVLKHEFVVRKGGNVSDIKLKYGGASGLNINNDGGINATTSLGSITEHAPETYQQDGKKVNSKFELNNNIVSYKTEPYSGDLIIDPSLLWATYYGGTFEDWLMAASSDGAGNIYVTGRTMSLSDIATVGAYIYTQYIAGGEDAMLIKFNAAGVRQWGTYYGGDAIDEGYDVKVDAADNIYITGLTWSTAGIATFGSHSALNNGFADAYLAKFDGSGTLLWGTYFGGQSEEFGRSVTVDAVGNVYLCGSTTTFFPTSIATTGAHQTVYGFGGSPYGDCFLAKFSTSGVLQWCTLYGGSGDETGLSVTTDISGNVFLCGLTSSTTAIASAGSYQSTNGGGQDVFLAKFNSAGVRQWGTYFGGTGGEEPAGLATDASGEVYMVGSSTSTASIATSGAYQSVYGGGGADCFIAKFTSGGALRWGTYLGGSLVDRFTSLKINGKLIYVTGLTESSTGISTAGTYQPVFGGILDAVLTSFDTSGALLWSTYFGTTGEENALGSALDPSGTNLYIVGITNSPSGIATTGAHQPAYGGGTYDGLLAKFNVCALPVVDTIQGVNSVCVGASTVFTNDSVGGVWSAANSNVTITGAGGVTLGVTAGTTTISYTLTNACGSTVVTRSLTVLPILTVGTITGPVAVCQSATVTLSNAVTGGVWSSNATSIATINSSGLVTGIAPGTATISYLVANSCGSATATATITVNPLPVAGTITGATTVCELSSIALSSTVSGGLWSSAATGVATVNSSGIVSGVAPGTAVIAYAVSNGCGTASTTTTVTVNTLSPSAGTITGSATVCVSSTTTLTDPVPGGVWSSSATGIAVVNSSGGVTGVAVGTATISYTLNNGCGTDVATFPILVNPAMSAGTITGPTSLCPSATISLSDATPGGAWSSTATTIATISSAGLVSGLLPGTTTVSYTITSGCGTVAATAVITVDPLPATGTLSGPGMVCMLSSITLSPSSPGGTWSSSSTAVASVSGAGLVSGISVGSATISYTVANVCGSAVTTTTIMVSPLPFAGSMSGASDICIYSSAPLTPSISGGTWSSSNTAIASVSAGGLVAGLAVGTTTISYAITNSCGTAFVTKTISISPVPFVAPITGAATACFLSTVTLSNVTPGGIWISGDTSIATVTGGVVTSRGAGKVGIYYSITNGCGGAVASMPVTFYPAPVVTVVNEGYVLSTTKKYLNYQWSYNGDPIPGATGQSYLITRNGSYNVSVTDSNGCTGNSGAKLIAGLATGSLSLGGNGGYVYPNPNTGTFTLSLSSAYNEQAHVIITNVVGQKVKEFTTTTNKPVEITLTQPAGTYILNAITANGRYIEQITIK